MSEYSYVEWRCLSCGKTTASFDTATNREMCAKLFAVPFELMPKLDHPRCPACKSENVEHILPVSDALRSAMLS